MREKPCPDEPQSQRDFSRSLHKRRQRFLPRLSSAERDELIELLTRVHATLSERTPANAAMIKEEDAADEPPVADRHGPAKTRRAAIARPRGEKEEILPEVESGR